MNRTFSPCRLSTWFAVLLLVSLTSMPISAEEKCEPCEEYIYLPIAEQPMFLTHPEMYEDYLTTTEDAVPTESIYMAKYPVTLGEYLSFINSEELTGKVVFERIPDDVVLDESGNVSLKYHSKRTVPAYYVSWAGANEYIKWLNSRSEDSRYRLPTAGEYTYAATNGGRTLYPWGDSPTRPDGEAFRVRGEYFSQPPVGAYRSNWNAWGVADLIGHRKVWTSSDYLGWETDETKTIKGGTRGPSGNFWLNTGPYEANGFWNIGHSIEMRHPNNAGTQGLRIVCEPQ